MQNQQIIDVIEEFAPPRLQESYDNTGLQVGDPSAEATGVLLCVDVTEDVVAEAAARDCNLIISHHPLLFHGLKCVAGRTRPERVLAAAILAGVTIYSAHTSADSTLEGVSWRMARMLGLRNVSTLVPVDAEGHGLGVVGDLPQSLTVDAFVALVKKVFGCESLRRSRSPFDHIKGAPISRVALCGGAGGDLIPQAIAAGAQAMVTADCRHNLFLDYAHAILLIDAGHFETEYCTTRIFHEILSEKFPDITIDFSNSEQNPVIYA